jgi:hypothetical protein
MTTFADKSRHASTCPRMLDADLPNVAPARKPSERGEVGKDGLREILVIAADRAKPAGQVLIGEERAVNRRGIVELVALAAVRDREVPGQNVHEEFFSELQKRIDKIAILIFSTEHGPIMYSTVAAHALGSRVIAAGTMSRLTSVIDPGNPGVSAVSDHEIR